MEFADSAKPVESERSLEAISVVQRFEEIVLRYSESDAVVDSHDRLSYAQLNQRANSIAHALIARGIDHEEPVGIAMPKSVDLIAAVLGILKAGAAYVPFVENQPIARLKGMIDDVCCRFVIGERGYLDEIYTDQVSRIEISSCLLESDSNPERAVGADQLAYILYTSGSTGTPKGVMIEHSGVIRLVCDQVYLPFGPDFHFLFAAPMSFDVSTLEIFTPLLHGAKLVIAPSGEPDPEGIRALCHQENVRSTCMAFGLFASLFESCPEIFKYMPIVAVGGEQVGAGIVSRAQRALPNTKFINAYGPTEATMLATTYQIPDQLDPNSEYIPIGRPLRGVNTYVLDESLKRVSDGEAGELCLSGIGIARGYLNQPEMSDQSFMRDPFAGDPLFQLYRTGDLVKVDRDGQLVFLGRMDSQVKVRGYRIELGEIESCATRIPAVSQAVAVVVCQGSDQQIALVCVGKIQAIEPGELREQLLAQLPEYMMPGLIEVVDELPLNRNGKIDRKAITEYIESKSSQVATRDGQPLETDTERVLGSLVRSVLELDSVFADDVFLRIGGHSLRAVVLCSRVRDQLGVSLPISKVYTLGSIRGIARWIDEQRGVDAGEQAQSPSIQQVDQGNRSLLSFNQQRLWMLDQLQPNDPSYHISIELIHEGELNRSYFERAWETVCQRHEVFRSRIELIENQPMQIIEPYDSSSIRWIDCTNDTDAEIQSMMSRESMRVFHLDTSPLVRCRVFVQGNQSSVLVTMHHMISDAWSCEVLSRELNSLYAAYADGRDPQLPELSIQYTDFAYQQRQLPEQLSYQNDIAYWKQTLEGYESVELPTDFGRTAKPSSVGKRVSHRLSEADTARIRASADRVGVTPFAYMLGVFKVWLHRLTAQDDILIGIPIANRQWAQTEELIGFFMETVALRTQMACSDSLGDVIRRVSSTTLDAFDHRNVPFQHIVNELHTHADQGRNPLFEVFFNHIALNIRQSGSDEVLKFRESEINNQTAKFDLTCYVFDEQDSIEIVFNYRQMLFAQESMDWFLEQYTELLCGSCDQLITPISQLKIGEPLELSSETWENEHQSSLVYQVVQSVRDLHPDRTAISWVDGSLNYAQLWDQSTQILGMLQEQQVTAGERVLVSSDQPGELGAAILAVLRCGAMFIPIDRSWPIRRLEQIAEIAQPTLAIVDDEIARRLRSFEFSGCIIKLDAKFGAELGAELAQHNPASTEAVQPIEPSTQSPAYMMFTSGSSGEPKGVVQSHAGLVSMMHAFADSIKMTHEDRILQLSSPAFDAAIMDMFAAWCRGASLCVFDIQQLDRFELGRFIDNEAITIYHSAPSVYRWFSSTIDQDQQHASIRAVVLGGEPVYSDDLFTLDSSFPQCRLFVNGLGLTESSLALQFQTTPDQIERYLRRVPVGTAAPGSRARLVDRVGNQTTLAGEIQIESDRIALGYWNGQTQSIDPIGEPVGDGKTRKFQTGDLGLMRADGGIEYLGRKDRQVQVHGCRVELSEVVHAIKSMPSVDDAAVQALALATGDHELVGFVVSEECDSVTEGELNQHLGDQLPRYMIPSRWHRVDHIPRVGGGKINTRAFDQLHRLPLGEDLVVDTDSSPMEVAAVQRAFEQVLRVDAVEPGDNFFHLGGNSLKAIMLFSALRKELGTHLPISAIYNAPTPYRLANEVCSYNSSSSNHPSAATFVSLAPGKGNDPVYLLPGIGGQPMNYAPLVNLLHSDRPFVGVHLPGLQQLHAIGNDLKQLASWLIDQMNLEQSNRAPSMIGYSFGGALAVEIATQLQDRGFDPAHLILLDAHLPFGLPKKSKAGVIATHLGQVIRGSEGGRVGYVLQRINSQTSKPVGNQAEANADTPAELQEFQKIAKVNRQMLGAYIPTSPYKSPVRLVQANKPEWFKFHTDDKFNGWASAIDPKLIKKINIDAMHLDLFKALAVERIAEMVDQWLKEEH